MTPQNRQVMFSFFRKHRDTHPDTISPSALLPRRMELAERKVFRREMLEQVLRDSLQTRGLLAGVQHWRFFPQDERHHRFIAVIDVGVDFAQRLAAAGADYPDIEALMRQNAYTRCGLRLEGVYWRARAQARPTPAAVAPQYQRVSDEEKQALMEAIQQGLELPVLHVGDLEYQTDMAPLDDSAPVRPVRQNEPEE